MDYTIWVNGFNEEDLYRFVFYYELVPVIGADSGITYGEWINEVGNASEPWSLSLEDDEWLEVKSAQIITSYGARATSILKQHSSVTTTILQYSILATLYLRRRLPNIPSKFYH